MKSFLKNRNTISNYKNKHSTSWNKSLLEHYLAKARLLLKQDSNKYISQFIVV